MGVYLDYNASAPIDSRVLETMIEIYKNVYGNADSRTHEYGEEARKVVEAARQKVASLLRVDKSEVLFTSGATESNNIVIQGQKEYAEKSGKKHIITSAVEHKSVLETVKKLGEQGYDIDFVYPKENGRIDAQELLELVRDDTLLVSVMHVNNETGMIQPVKEIGEALINQGILFHIDATQSCGKLVPQLQDLNYNMMSFSAHKLSGPQGIGALVLRKKRYSFPPVKAIVCGGQQEHGIRPGTVPVALAAGFGRACELAEWEYESNTLKCKEIKKTVVSLIEESGLQYQINGDQEFCISNTINISFKGIESETLLLCSKKYCAISSGAACNSNHYNLSYVLSAMGLQDETAAEAVRISWGHDTDQDELIEQLSALLKLIKGFL